MKAFLLNLKRCTPVWVMLLAGGLTASAQNTIFEENFSQLTGATHIGGNDGVWDDGFSDDMTPELADNTAGWVFDHVNAGHTSVRIGSKNNPGSMTTPALDALDGNATLTFKANGYSDDAFTLTVSISKGKLTYEGTTGSAVEIDIPATDMTQATLYTTYQVDITEGEAGSTLTFATSKKKERCIMGSIRVVRADAAQLAKPQLSFGIDKALVGLESTTFVAPTAQSTASGFNGSITYTSSDPSVATVDEATGALTLLDNGETTITATSAATSTFASGTAKYTLTVTKKNAKTARYTKVTDQAQVKDGETYIIVEPTLMKALAEAGNNEFKSADVYMADDSYFGATNAEGLPTAFTLEAADGENCFSLESGGKYLKLSTAADTDVTMTDNKETDGLTTWKVEVKKDGTTNVDNEEATSGEQRILYRESKDQYKAYDQHKVTTDDPLYDADYHDVALYLRTTAHEANQLAIMTAEGIATFYAKKAVIVPTGLKAGVVSSTENGTVTVDFIYNAGDAIPAGTPVIVNGAQGIYTFDEADAEGTSPERNLLSGSYSAETTTDATAGCHFYKLAYDADGHNLGFYYGAADGAAFTNAAQHAYLALPQATAAGFALKWGTLEGIGSTSVAPTTPTGIYTIDGRRSTIQDVNQLSAGMYIVNGKKIIINR